MNVLEVMSRCADELQRQHMTSYAIELDEARKVVAELIQEVKDTLSSHPSAVTYPDGPCIERVQRILLRNALARIGGAP